MIPFIKKFSNPFIAAEEMFKLSQHLATWDWFVVVLSFFATTAILILFYTALFESFRTLHQLNKSRALF